MYIECTVIEDPLNITDEERLQHACRNDWIVCSGVECPSGVSKPGLRPDVPLMAKRDQSENSTPLISVRKTLASNENEAQHVTMVLGLQRQEE